MSRITVLRGPTGHDTDVQGPASRPCEREGRSQGAPARTFRLRLRRGQAPAVLEENMVKLAETWLTEPGVDKI